MQSNHYEPTTSRSTTTVDAGLKAHFQRVYNNMALGLVVTGLVAYIVASTPALLQAIYGTPLSWVVMFAPLGIIFFGLTPRKLQSMQLSTATGLYYLITALMGMSLAYIFLIYSGESLARVFFITAGMFGATSIFGYTTKKDLSGMGSLMFMGLIGIIIASLVNIFLQSTMIMFVTSVIGVVVFTGLIAWETQHIREAYYAIGNHAEMRAKAAIMGALGLYINFINLFLTLLRLFGSRD